MYRIRALQNFGSVKAGDIGGFIESEKNLSQQGNCWVYDDAKVYGNGYVANSAIVLNKAEVYESGAVYGNAVVKDKAVVSGESQVYGYATICDTSRIIGTAQIFGSAEVSGNSVVCTKVMVLDSARVVNSLLYGDICLFDRASVENIHHTGDLRLEGSERMIGEPSDKQGNLDKLKAWAEENFGASNVDNKMRIAARKSAEDLINLEKEGQLFDGWSTSDEDSKEDYDGKEQ